MNVLLLSMPDFFWHMPPVAFRVPQGGLASLAGNVDPHHHVAIAGLVLAGLFWLVGLAAPTRIKNWREACFVVSPGGCGLVQGPLSGELKWYELRDVTFRGRAGFSWGGDGEAGLVLNVPGASIVVADIYHRPLAYIQEIVRQFWSRDQQSNK